MRYCNRGSNSSPLTETMFFDTKNFAVCSQCGFRHVTCFVQSDISQPNWNISRVMKSTCINVLAHSCYSGIILRRTSPSQPTGPRRQWETAEEKCPHKAHPRADHQQTCRQVTEQEREQQNCPTGPLGPVQLSRTSKGMRNKCLLLHGFVVEYYTAIAN